MRSLIVDQNYQELGRFLDLPEIQWLHFDEIDTDIKKLSDDDIEDLEGGFIDYCGIIVGAYKAGWITDDQIATYGLEFAVGQSSGGGGRLRGIPPREGSQYGCVAAAYQTAMGKPA